MNRKLMALVAAFMLLALAVTPGAASVRPPGADAAPAPAPALPASAVDQTKVPHYFGPYPNWANSPQVVQDVAVKIGDGTGATATATIDPITGGVASFQITDPGNGYDPASPPGVVITGAGTLAAAHAVVNPLGSVTSVKVDTSGGGYAAAPVVAFSGGIGASGPPLTPPSTTAVVPGVLSYNVSVGNATGGTFTINDGVDALTAIAWDANAAAVQSALPSASSVTDTAGTGPWVVTFAATPASFTFGGTGLTATPVPVGDSGATVGATPDLWSVTAGSATAGTFTLSVDGIVTAPIAFNASASEVATALGVGVATVTGIGSIADPWVITFTVPPTTPPIVMDGSLLTQPGVVTGAGATPVPAALPTVFKLNIGSATGGSYTLAVNGGPSTTPLAWNATAGDIQTALAGPTVTGSAPAFDVTFAAPPTTFSVDGALLTQGGTGAPPVAATATASGGVDFVIVDAVGGGYSTTSPVTVDFDLPDLPDGVKATGTVQVNPDGTIATITVVDSGSGYLTPPGVAIYDGTTRWDVGTGAGATAHTTLKVLAVALDTFGSGYVTAPTVTITGGTTNATATATTSFGAVTGIVLDAAGSGYLTPGLKKFVDGLPGLCDPDTTRGAAPACPTDPAAKAIPLAVPDPAGPYQAPATRDVSDTYEIGLVQYRTKFASSLPATLVRGYVQLETPANAAISQHFPLVNEMLIGAPVPVFVNGAQAYGVTPPQYLGPTIVATRDKAVRIVFRNLLPVGEAGNLFLPVDSTIMGSGTDPTAMPAPVDLGTVMDEVRNPTCGEPGPKPMGCFTDDRATLHLHGGVTPWISDGTPHQWITPANETTAYPQGVSVQNVPDMDACGTATDGCQTFYYTNQQSARLMFYHDHAWGITRLNVYAGEAAGYLVTDTTEAKLMGTGGPLEGLGLGIPLVIQDKTFVSSPAEMARQDPTWDSSRWGGEGSLWVPHVYMPAQNPGDPTGLSAFGRWMYGPWFWPPATNVPYQPIRNPYYDATCDPNVAQFCEPLLIPGTPNITVGMEAFNDTPIVNGTAYPTVTLDPKTYRLRVLNAAGDRFWNLQWYVGESATARTENNNLGQPIGPTEVTLNPLELAAAQTDPVIFPTPAAGQKGPDWIQIGTEGGFLPTPVVVDGQQPTTWITDPTRFDVGNVDKHSLLLAPAERADVVVDFSQFAGKTLILYNDAPAAFPARVPGYDYYTGGPDLSPAGAPTTLPGYGPNTRTVMQVKIADVTPAPYTKMTALNNAFKHHADGSGVFESSQHPIIVGQAAYNSAYGTSFAASGWCNAPGATGTAATRCDGFARIQEGSQPVPDPLGSFGFNTLLGQNTKMKIPFERKGMHDEMNSTSFDEYGRMQATIGLEAPGATPLLQNIILYPFVNPSTELIDATNLPVGDIGVKPISSATDGTQIWKITHNGVDTHPIHFHLFDVQVLNRASWDGIILAPDPAELGWKETVRISPLQDTYVAVRPIIPKLPFEVPNAIRALNPMMPLGSTVAFNNVDPLGNPTNPIVNALVNFGWEYVYHCHILSHEEMDMMRPVTVALPPKKADGLTFAITGPNNNRRITVTWMDNSRTETSFLVQRTTDGITWTNAGTSPSPLDQPNTSGTTRSLTDTTSNPTTAYLYRVVAQNTVGYGGQFPSLTVRSDPATAGVNAPAAPTTLTATLQAGPQVSLTWRDNATNETGFVIQRAANGGAFAQIATAPARNSTGNVTFVDTTALPGNTYTYKVAAVNIAGTSPFSNTAQVVVPPAPAAPTTFDAANGPNGNGNNRTVNLVWTASPTNVTGFTIQRATNAIFTTGLNTVNVAATATTLAQTGLSRSTTYYFRIRANNGAFVSSGWVNSAPASITTNP